MGEHWQQTVREDDTEQMNARTRKKLFALSWQKHDPQEWRSRQKTPKRNRTKRMNMHDFKIFRKCTKFYQVLFAMCEY